MVKNSPFNNKTWTVIFYTMILLMESLSVLIVGGDSFMHYLLKRYAEKIGLSTRVLKTPLDIETIRKLETVAVIFSSVESLEGERLLVAQFTNLDVPIIVCSSAFEQIKTIELGADYCLLPPVVLDNFSSILSTALKMEMD